MWRLAGELEPFMCERLATFPQEVRGLYDGNILGRQWGSLEYRYLYHGFAEDLSLHYTGTFHNIPVFPKIPKISNGAHAKGILYF